MKVALPPQCSPEIKSPTWQHNQNGGNPLTGAHTRCSCIWGLIYPARNSGHVARVGKAKHIVTNTTIAGQWFGKHSLKAAIVEPERKSITNKTATVKE
jgi:hypothetical protein